MWVMGPAHRWHSVEWRGHLASCRHRETRGGGQQLPIPHSKKRTMVRRQHKAAGRQGHPAQGVFS